MTQCHCITSCFLSPFIRRFVIDLQQYQYFFNVKRLGVGLCTSCHAPPTANCIAKRIALAVEYGVSELDIWALWDSTVKNFSVVEQQWRPFVAPLRAFLAGEDVYTIHGGDGKSAAALCWNESST